MKVLFITDKDVNLVYSGAQVMTNRNYLSLCSIFGEENVDVLQLNFLSYKFKMQKILNVFRLYNDFLNPDIVDKIVQKSKNYKSIILDFSIWGIISKKLKKNGYKGKIICFFHNVEFSYYWQENKFYSIVNLIKLFNIFFNEKLSCKYSDTIIALNKRDAKYIFKYYNRKTENIIPISIPDANKNFNISCQKINLPIKLLFLGSYFWANEKGIIWFVENVLPFTNNIELTIAGNGMNQLKNKIDTNKIILFDKVKDLKPLIDSADFFLIPIFHGSGMKVKTAEALMYGKNIIGTTEAFSGYNVEYNKVGALCNTKKEFIDFLNSSNINKFNRFNSYSRNQFEFKYSFKATLKQFENFLVK